MDRLKFRLDKNLSVLSEVLLKYALQKDGVIFPKEVLADKNGKPYIDGIFFNISHSNEYVAVAISDKEVGCDIEKITDINSDIAKRYFSPKEYEKIIACESEEEKKILFFRLWTLKESFLKAIGLGLNQPLNSFTINFEKEITVTQNITEKDYSFYEYNGIKDYSLSICTLQKSVEFIRVDTKDIL